MIIDFHQHFTAHKIEKAEALRRAQNHVAIWHRSAGIKIEKPLSEMAKERIDISDDPDGRKLLQRMEEASIDLTVIFSTDRVYEHLDEKAIMAEQRGCAGLARRNPKKLIAFASILPYRKNAPQLFRRCIEEYGMRGLKWQPNFGFDPISIEAYKVLEVAQELKVPLLMHTGSMYGPANSKLSHPILLDQLAIDFPELKIVGAHMGHILWHDWCAVSYFKRNIYGDLAEWQVFAVGKYDWFCHTLREIIDLVGVDRIIFSSDGPWFELVISNALWVNIIKNLPRNAPKGIKFTEEEVTAILGGNAKEVLGI